jgi:hypothetical protein
LAKTTKERHPQDAQRKGGNPVKFARAAQGRNSMQTTLIDSSSMPIFGDPVTPQQLERIEGQQQRVEAIMAGGFWYTLPAIQKELKRRFGQLYSETSISARLRVMRKRGFTVNSERTHATSNLYQYRATKECCQAPKHCGGDCTCKVCAPELAARDAAAEQAIAEATL